MSDNHHITELIAFEATCALVRIALASPPFSAAAANGIARTAMMRIIKIQEAAPTPTSADSVQADTTPET